MMRCYTNLLTVSQERIANEQKQRIEPLASGLFQYSIFETAVAPDDSEKISHPDAIVPRSSPVSSPLPVVATGILGR